MPYMVVLALYGHGCFVSLSPNSNYDSQRWDRQPTGEVHVWQIYLLVNILHLPQSTPSMVYRNFYADLIVAHNIRGTKVTFLLGLHVRMSSLDNFDHIIAYNCGQYCVFVIERIF
jgi:hypothetical protein